METNSFEVDSKIHPRGALTITDSPAEEPSFIGACCSVVREHAGRVVHGFLDAVNQQGWADESFLAFVYNTPLIPNSWATKTPEWHVDGDDGTTIANLKREPVEHLICAYTYDGPEANTEFALGRVKITVPKNPGIERHRFPWWEEQIESQIRSGTLTKHSLSNRELCYFDDNAFHRTPWITTPGRRILMIATRIRDIRIEMIKEHKVLNLNGRCYVPTKDGKGWELKQV